MTDVRPGKSRKPPSPPRQGTAKAARSWQNENFGEQWNLEDTVAKLRDSREVTHNIRHGRIARRLPSRLVLAEVVNQLSAALFPTHFSQPDLHSDSIDEFVGATLEHALCDLVEQIRLSLPLGASGAPLPFESSARVAHDISQEFAAQLPSIRAMLAVDLRTAYEGDPSAVSMPEILLGYPGMVAIICYRLARSLHLLGAPLVARLMTLVAHSRTGIDIHPGAEIGSCFFIDHGTGLVIGETAIIGERVRLSQSVTLGASRSSLDGKGLAVRGVARHPIVEDDVVIHVGATLLGRITIGRGSIIGGNVWLTQSVPPKSNVLQPLPRGLGRRTPAMGEAA